MVGSSVSARTSKQVAEADPLKLDHYLSTASVDEAEGSDILLVRVSAPHHVLFEES